MSSADATPQSEKVARAKLLSPHPWAGAIGPIVGGDDDFVVIELDRGAPWKTTFAGPGEWRPWPTDSAPRAPWWRRLLAAWPPARSARSTDE